MDYLFSQWDGEDTIIRLDRAADAWIIIAIHSTRLGPAAGGTRMKTYERFKLALRDAHSLSAAMTYKFALAGIPRGGGKSVIAVPAGFDLSARDDLLRRYGLLIKQLGGLFETGPDLGTSPVDMDVIAETGAPYVFGRTPANGGAGDSGPATALGVFSGMQAVCEYLFGGRSLSGKRVLVQGVGSVGSALISLLSVDGAEVLFNDADQSTVCSVRDELGLTFVPAEQVYDQPCDIFAPCALGGILNSQTIPRLTCLAVAGSANNQLAEPEDAERLLASGILYAPDYVINAGGAIALEGIESLGWSLSEVDERIRSIARTLYRVIEIAASEQITTEAASRRLAEARLTAAQSQ